MSQVAVVTDSTAYLPEGVADRYGITVVPLHVVLGGATGRENIDLGPAEVAAALAERRVHVTTSRPTPGELADAYRACGASQVVSVHLSSTLSGTAESALLAARDVASEGVEVRVVDSRSVAMGLGFTVVAAAEAAAAGKGIRAVEGAAMRAAEATTTLLYVDTLEHLRRGGRVRAASALVGAALGVKPILTMAGGELVLLEKVRTSGKATARLLALSVAAAGEGPVDVAVHHLAAEGRAAQLATDLQDALPRCRSVQISEVGAVVGAHVGPGCLGVVLWRH
jgi:DegV family protein with EDD domain